MADTNPRLRAGWDLSVAEVREYAGRHEYDGRIQDLSPDGVRPGMRRLADAVSAGGRLDDEHDEAHLAVFERAAQVRFGELELHRSNPYFHIGNMDLACYDREYAPQEERDRARAAHLAAWPDAVDAAIAALDTVPVPVAQALAGAARGLAAGIPDDAYPELSTAALAAHARLVSHLARAAGGGRPDAALGGQALTALMGSAEGTEVDLARLAERADAERDRLSELLAESCARADPGRPAIQGARDLVRQHPDADGVIEAARVWTKRAIDFTREAALVPYNDGEALVRVTRLACAIGVHTAGMSVEDAARRFESDTHIAGQAALAEAARATFDPTYGRYTWGKLEIMALRERARAAWGSGFSLQRFHSALLELGSPPLGLLDTAVRRG